jgi:hypothetical protein
MSDVTFFGLKPLKFMHIGTVVFLFRRELFLFSLYMMKFDRDASGYKYEIYV